MNTLRLLSLGLVWLAWLAAATRSAHAQIQPAADAPQPLPPEESLQRFQLEPGFRIELVASEPLLADPTDMAFDARGRILVCELHGYNLDGYYDILELNKTGQLDTQVRRILANPEALARAEKETHGTVKLLADTDGDGRMDQARVWADDLPACYGVVPARQGVIVLCAPDIVYLADLDDDGQAEVRETLFTGFGTGELWTRISNPCWGPDNWIYAACGAESAGTIRGPHLPEPVSLGHTGFRFKADGSRFEPVSGGTSGFGLTMTEWGERFLVSNQQHALAVAPLPFRYLARNPYIAAPPTVLNVCDYGHPARVFPAAPPDPWRLKRSEQPEWVRFYGAAETTMGLITAACAPLIYQTDQFPPSYHGNHFSCDNAYNLVHRCLLEPDGLGWKARRATKDREFLTSTEQWFRPVNLVDGPDGALYVVDMYREIIEDYSAIPRYLQQQYGLIKGHDRGRIWRVVADQRPRPPALDLTRLASAELVSHLADSNAWRGQTAQRLLVERQDLSVVPPLQNLLQHHPYPLARLRALSTLEGLGRLEANEILSALGDVHFGIRLHALQRADLLLDKHPALLDKVLGLTNDPDPKVRLQLAFTLGESKDPRRWPALVALANREADHPWMRAALLSSVPHDAGRMLHFITSRAGDPGQSRALVQPLVGIIASRQDPAELGNLIQLVASSAGNQALVFQTNSLAGLLENLRRGTPPQLEDPATLRALSQLLASPFPAVRLLTLQLAGALNMTHSAELRPVFEQAARQALDTEAELAARTDAVALLTSGPFDLLESTGHELLQAHQPLDVQLAAIAALAASDNAAVGGILLSAWKGYTPTAQAEVLTALFQRQDRLPALLDAMERELFLPSRLDPFRRNLLLTHPDEALRARAEGLLRKEPPSADQQVLLDHYHAALQQARRDAARGKELFLLNCANCHQLEGQGQAVGPELTAATKGRADETLLLDILQPSDQITAGYSSYTVTTKNGALFNGILSGESATSITLPDEEGFVQTILRKDIASMQVSPISLMPANFAELLKPQDVADLIGYVRQVSGPASKGLSLFDEDRAFAASLNEGQGTAMVSTEDHHSGQAALCVTPPQRFSPRIAGWNYPIVEKPEAGQYRYLRFAWKAPEAQGVMLELAASGQWPPPHQPLRRYYAGRNTTGWEAQRLAEQPPREWTVVLVDLWRDFGEFDLTGLAPTAMGGPVWFDSMELLASP